MSKKLSLQVASFAKADYAVHAVRARRLNLRPNHFPHPRENQ